MTLILGFSYRFSHLQCVQLSESNRKAHVRYAPKKDSDVCNGRIHKCTPITKLYIKIHLYTVISMKKRLMGIKFIFLISF